MLSLLNQTERLALLWDESHLWGLMARDALIAAGIRHDIVTAEEVCSGVLNKYPLLFVPGGWASLKSRRLGSTGRKAIRNFVESGGTYFGVCGGAGLALEVDGGLGLLPVTRVPTADRVPSFSGQILVRLEDPGFRPNLWSGIPLASMFHAWWPSQFRISDESKVSVLGRYEAPTERSYSSDIPVADVPPGSDVWKDLEDLYGILLDPARLYGQPAVISGTRGNGRVILSMLHFDTPDDETGRIVLRNLARECGVRIGLSEETGFAAEESGIEHLLFVPARQLMKLGEQNFLWRWRTPYLIQWRRGVRGLEFCTLYVVTRELAVRLTGSLSLSPEIEARVREVAPLIADFAAQAAQLLLSERFALQSGQLTFKHCNDPAITAMRDRLFSRSKSHGGMFKTLLDLLDSILLALLRSEKVGDRAVVR